VMLSQVTVNIHHVRSFYFVSESLYSTVVILMTATGRVLFCLDILQRTIFGKKMCTFNYVFRRIIVSVLEYS